jgi:hypothetical protein
MLKYLKSDSIVRTTWIVNFSLGGLAFFLGWVDIYFVEIYSVMNLLQICQFIAVIPAVILLKDPDFFEKKFEDHFGTKMSKQSSNSNSHMGSTNYNRPQPAPPAYQATHSSAHSISNKAPSSASISQISKKQASTSLTKDEVDIHVQMSLEGLVGFDSFIENLSHELYDFLTKQPGASKGIVIWGDSSVGKTELGQRLAGEKQDFNIPGLDLDGVDVKYIACCDGQVDISKEVNEASPKSIIILDEIDKFVVDKSGMVNEALAKGLRTSIVTNFQKKPIFWVFCGTFHDVRGKGKLTEKELSQVLGTELSSRIDFADWRLPSWTTETLLDAGKIFLTKDEEKIDYDDEGLVLLVKQALDSGGGVRQLQNYHDYFKRQASKIGKKICVGKKEVEEYLRKLNEA